MLRYLLFSAQVIFVCVFAGHNLWGAPAFSEEGDLFPHVELCINPEKDVEDKTPLNAQNRGAHDFYDDEGAYFLLTYAVPAVVCGLVLYSFYDDWSHENGFGSAMMSDFFYPMMEFFRVIGNLIFPRLIEHPRDVYTYENPFAMTPLPSNNRSGRQMSTQSIEAPMPIIEYPQGSSLKLPTLLLNHLIRDQPFLMAAATSIFGLRHAMCTPRIHNATQAVLKSNQIDPLGDIVCDYRTNDDGLDSHLSFLSHLECSYQELPSEHELEQIQIKGDHCMNHLPHVEMPWEGQVWIRFSHNNRIARLIDNGPMLSIMTETRNLASASDTVTRQPVGTETGTIILPNQAPTQTGSGTGRRSVSESISRPGRSKTASQRPLSQTGTMEEVALFDLRTLLNNDTLYEGLVDCRNKLLPYYTYDGFWSATNDTNRVHGQCPTGRYPFMNQTWPNTTNFLLYDQVAMGWDVILESIPVEAPWAGAPLPSRPANSIILRPNVTGLFNDLAPAVQFSVLDHVLNVSLPVGSNWLSDATDAFEDVCVHTWANRSWHLNILENPEKKDHMRVIKWSCSGAPSIINILLKGSWSCNYIGNCIYKKSLNTNCWTDNGTVSKNCASDGFYNGEIFAEITVDRDDQLNQQQGYFECVGAGDYQYMGSSPSPIIAVLNNICDYPWLFS